MSTTIDVYPTTSFMSPMEQTRAHTQEFSQQLLDRHGVGSQIETKTFYPSTGGSQLRFVGESLAQEPGMEPGFGYWINGEWDSTSWPGCFTVEDDDRITGEDLIYPFNSKPEHLELWSIVEEFEDLLPPEQLTEVLRRDHYWYEYRNVADPAIASTGYELVAVTLTEAASGVIASFDSAFDIEHNGESAQKFLAWWGEKQMAFYGTESFKKSHGVQIPAEMISSMSQVRASTA